MWGGDPAVSSNFTPDPDVEQFQVSGTAYESVYGAFFQKNMQGDNALMSFWFNDESAGSYNGVGVFNQLNFDGAELTLTFDPEDAPEFTDSLGWWYGGDYEWILDKGRMKASGEKSRVGEYHMPYGMWFREDWDVAGLVAQVYDDGAGGAVIYYMEYDETMDLCAARFYAGGIGLEEPLCITGGEEVNYYVIRTLPDPLVATTHHILWSEIRASDNGYRGLYWRSHGITAGTFDDSAFEPSLAGPPTTIDESADAGYSTDLVSAWVDAFEDLFAVYYNGFPFTMGDLRNGLMKANRKPLYQLNGVGPPPSKVYSRLYQSGVWGGEELVSINDPEWGAAYNGYGVLNDHSTANMLNSGEAGGFLGNGDIEAFMMIIDVNEDYMNGINKSYGGMYFGEFPYYTRLFVRTRR